MAASADEAPTTSPSCVRVFYDQTGSAGFRDGQLHATAVQNLLGHFPAYQSRISPIEKYKSGQLEDCKATIYVGTVPGNPIPAAFLADYGHTTKNVFWLGSNLDQIPAVDLKNLLGFEYAGVTSVDNQHLDAQRRPTFFRAIQYKGETFEKFGEFDEGTTHFSGDFSMIRLKDSNMGGTALAQAEHGWTHEKIPFAVRKQNRFYMADVPFEYLHEGDRYLIFADLLFDLLGESPRFSGKKPAVFRIEDISSCVPDAQLARIAQIARETSTPFAVALIPIYADPFHANSGCTGSPARLEMNQDARFLTRVRDLIAANGHLVWHGVTHQMDSSKNPSGVSGEDYEFWDMVHGRPSPFSQPRLLLDRLATGWTALSASGLSPQIWEVPHYLAAPQDYRIFAQVFSWSIGRITYFPHRASGLPGGSNPNLWFETNGMQGQTERIRQLAGAQITLLSPQNFGQFFPYEIYGDAYGQRVLPENMGYFEEYNPAAVNHMLAIAKRNRVIRDAWASFFFHPYLLEGQSDSELRRFLQGIRDLGYEFVDLDAFVRERKNILRPEPDWVSLPE